MNTLSETGITSSCPQLLPVQQHWLQMPALGGIRPYAQMDLQRSPRDGPLAWLLVGLWVGRGAFLPSNPPSAHFPCSLEGTQGTDPGQPPPDHLVTIHKGYKRC